LYIGEMQVVLRWWKISLRNDVRMKPGEVKDSYEDFLCDYRGQSMCFYYAFIIRVTVWQFGMLFS